MSKATELADALADELRRLDALIEACEPYLKNGETPAERIARERNDTAAMTRLYAKERAKTEALLDALKWIADHDLHGADLTVCGHMAHGFIGKARAALAEQPQQDDQSRFQTDSKVDFREQEPVAWRHLHEDGWEYYDAPTGSDCDKCQPLYTAPPRQEEAIREAYERGVIDGCLKNAESRVTRYMDQTSRKPLTEDEIKDAVLVNPAYGFALMSMMRDNIMVPQVIQAVEGIARAVERAHNITEE